MKQKFRPRSAQAKSCGFFASDLLAKCTSSARNSTSFIPQNPWKLFPVGRKLPLMPDNSRVPPKGQCFRVLGVDPAAAGPTGYGILETDGKNCRVLHYGAFRASIKRQKSSPGAVLHDVHALLCQLLKEFQPQAMAVESVFTALNMRTALRLAEVRGVVLLAAEQHKIEVRSYSPREVKACVAGYGHADKRQMQIMVQALLHMPETPEPSHAADALAIGLCYLQARQLEERFGLASRVAASNRTPHLLSSLAVTRTTASRIPRIPPLR
jgi:crossover junction endodeoxyribonuclease RuvC